MTPGFWSGKRVLLTGHTGFKGGWLSLWLQSFGADVHGLALQPPAGPNFFTVASVAKGMASSSLADIRDYAQVVAVVDQVRPEIVFHLAALVAIPYSYHSPDTYVDTNVKGTLNVVQAARAGSAGRRLIRTAR